jgi:hypothetical protein
MPKILNNNDKYKSSIEDLNEIYIKKVFSEMNSELKDLQNNLLKMYNEDSVRTKENIGHCVILATQIIEKYATQINYQSPTDRKKKFVEDVQKIFPKLTIRQANYLANNDKISSILLDGNFGPLGGGTEDFNSEEIEKRLTRLVLNSEQKIMINSILDVMEKSGKVPNLTYRT